MSGGRNSLELVARHEAGHCLGLIETGHGVRQVTIQRRTQFEGTKFETNEYSGKAYPQSPVVGDREELMVGLAGYAAEGITWRDVPDSDEDRRQAEPRAANLAKKLAEDKPDEVTETAEQILDAAQVAAAKLVADQADLLGRITRRLIGRRESQVDGKCTVSGEELLRPDPD